MKHIDALRQQLSDSLRDLCIQHDVPGAAAAVLDGNDTAEATFGVINNRTGVPVTPDTLFMLQSVTKMFTATLVMQLVDDGLVQLDDPIRRHVPKFHTTDHEASKGITIRHLLTHTGGFEGDLWAPTTSGPDALECFVDDLVTGARQNSPPGTQFSYCNAGFGVLGRLVEVLRGMTYEDAVRRYIADPLGIEEIAFDADQALAFRTSIGHVAPQPGAPLRPMRHWAVAPPSNPAAGNQLAMSARGVLTFARMHLADGRTPDGTQVVSAASARLMRKHHMSHPACSGPQSGHGLGWWLDRGETVGHGGGSSGVASKLLLVPRHGFAAVVLTNSESGGAVISELLEPLVSQLEGVAPPFEFPRQSIGIPDPQPYVGCYGTRVRRLDVDSSDGGLWLTVTPQHELLDFDRRAGTNVPAQRYELRPVGKHIFMMIDKDKPDEGGGTIEFLDVDDGGRAGFAFSGRAYPRVGNIATPKADVANKATQLS